jgi:hypothetical protein
MIPTDLCLTPQELECLTGRKKNGAQIKALLFMGIKHWIRPDGTVAVLRSQLSVDSSDPGKKPGKSKEPRFDLL